MIIYSSNNNQADVSTEDAAEVNQECRSGTFSLLYVMNAYEMVRLIVTLYDKLTSKSSVCFILLGNLFYWYNFIT